MKKDEIKSTLKQVYISDDGPTVVVVEKNKKQIPIKVIKKNDHIEVTIGKFIKRVIKIPINEIE